MSERDSYPNSKREYVNYHRDDPKLHSEHVPCVKDRKRDKHGYGVGSRIAVVEN